MTKKHNITISRFILHQFLEVTLSEVGVSVSL